MIMQASTANLLLRALSAADYALLQPALERVALPLRTVITAANEPIGHVHFLERGIASILTDSEIDGGIEFGLHGYEGLSGSAILLGTDLSPFRSLIQVGDAVSLRIASGALMEACRQSATLQAVLLRFVHTLTVQSAATASANAHHDLPERLARWLLMCHDRVDGDLIEITHEFMAQMLAVRRSGVTVTLHTLEATGAIRNTRGLVTVLDRGRLREIAGESYGAPEREYERLIAPFGLV